MHSLYEMEERSVCAVLSVDIADNLEWPQSPIITCFVFLVFLHIFGIAEATVF